MGHSSSTSVDRCRHRRLPSDPSGGKTPPPPSGGSSRGTVGAITAAAATRFQAKLAVLAVAAALLASLSSSPHRSGDDSASAPSSSGATANAPRGAMTPGVDDGSPVARIRYSAVLLTEGETRGSPTSHVRYAAYEVVGTSPASPASTGGEANDERRGQKPLSVRRWADVLSSSGPAGSKARIDFLRIIRDCPYGAVFLETKGASNRTADSKQFEFVLLDAPYLKSFAEGNPDPHTFAEHLNCGGEDEPEPAGCTFPSLGGDATLVAPRRPAGETRGDVPDSAYSHLAAFVRGVSMDRAERFWRLVVGEYGRALTSRETVWLSTDGTGVAWLHVRLDSRPKYYKYEEFAGAT